LINGANLPSWITFDGKSNCTLTGDFTSHSQQIIFSAQNSLHSISQNYVIYINQKPQVQKLPKSWDWVFADKELTYNLSDLFIDPEGHELNYNISCTQKTKDCAKYFGDTKNGSLSIKIPWNRKSLLFNTCSRQIYGAKNTLNHEMDITLRQDIFILIFCLVGLILSFPLILYLIIRYRMRKMDREFRLKPSVMTEKMKHVLSLEINIT